jgi:hypothetical protein
MAKFDSKYNVAAIMSELKAANVAALICDEVFPGSTFKPLSYL